MPVRHQLPFGSEPSQGLHFEVRIVTVDKVEDLGFQYEECSVDPAFLGLWLLRKLSDLVALHFEVAEAG